MRFSWQVLFYSKSPTSLKTLRNYIENFENYLSVVRVWYGVKWEAWRQCITLWINWDLTEFYQAYVSIFWNNQCILICKILRKLNGNLLINWRKACATSNSVLSYIGEFIQSKLCGVYATWVNPYNAQIFLYKTWRPKLMLIFQFKFMWMLSLALSASFEYLCYGSIQQIVYSFSARMDLRRQILTSKVDPHAVRLKVLSELDSHAFGMILNSSEYVSFTSSCGSGW